MFLKSKILVMFANQYDVEGTKGMTINYYFFGDHGENLEPKNNLSGAVGEQRSKCSLDYNDRDKISFVPGIYEASFEFSTGSDGKPVAKVKDLEFVGKAEIKMAAPQK